MTTQQQAVESSATISFAKGWLKPRYLLLALAVGLVLAHATLALSILQHSKAQQGLEADSRVARLALSSSPASPGNQPQTQLQQAQAELAAIQGAFPERVNPRAVTAWLLDAAQANKVEVTGLQTRSSAKRIVGSHSYMATPFTISLRGQPSDLLAFVAAVEGSAQQTLVVKGALFSSAKDGATLSMDLEIYARPPGEDAPAQGGTPSKPESRTSGKQ